MDRCMWVLLWLAMADFLLSESTTRCLEFMVIVEAVQVSTETTGIDKFRPGGFFRGPQIRGHFCMPFSAP